MVYSERGWKTMAKMIRDIALTHTPTTIQICIPKTYARVLGITEEKRVQVECDDVKKEITVRKIKGA